MQRQAPEALQALVRGAHPEVAIGIPRMVVTAKPAFKQKYAAICDYTGPLTLAEAVAQGHTSAERAELLVRLWEHAPSKQFAELPTPRVIALLPAGHPDVLG
jgi:hypothetical protein